MAFFFLWRGRYCTRLGPYNCVSNENLRTNKKWTRLARKNGKSVQTKNKTHQKPKRPPNSPARFVFRHKTTQRNNTETGQSSEASSVCNGRIVPVRPFQPPICSLPIRVLGLLLYDGSCEGSHHLACLAGRQFSPPHLGGNRSQSLAAVYIDWNRLTCVR